MHQFSCLGLQLPLELLQLVTLLFQLDTVGQDVTGGSGEGRALGMVGGALGMVGVGVGAPKRTFISDSRFTCSTWKASCSFTRATSSWLCCVTVSCLAVSAFCTDRPEGFGSGSAMLGLPSRPSE